MFPFRTYIEKLLQSLVYPATVAILGMGLCSQIARPAPEVVLRLIVVNSSEDAQAVLDTLKAGADFAVLARETSVDATSTDGGLLGKIDPASLRPELRDAVLGLEPGQLSGIVKIPRGFAVLRVLTDAEAGDIENLDRARQTAVRAQAALRYGPRVAGFDE